MRYAFAEEGFDRLPETDKQFIAGIDFVIDHVIKPYLMEPDNDDIDGLMVNRELFPTLATVIDEIRKDAARQIDCAAFIARGEAIEALVDQLPDIEE